MTSNCLLKVIPLEFLVIVVVEVLRSPFRPPVPCARVLRFQMLIRPIFTKIHSYSICNVEQQCTLTVEAFNHLSNLNVSLLNQLFRTGITIEFSSFSRHFESVLEDVIQFGYQMCTSWGLTKHRTLFSNTQMGYVELQWIQRQATQTCRELDKPCSRKTCYSRRSMT